MICESGMRNLLGNSKELILNYPSKMMGAGDLIVSPLRSMEKIDKIIDIHLELDKGFHHRFNGLGSAQLESWALHNSNSFYGCEYKGEFFGLLFALRLKPEAFEKMMNFEMREKDLKNEDFASFEEQGSNLLLSFFAMNDKAASLLFIRYYAHLIAHQKIIENVGLVLIMEDAKRLLGKMNLTHSASFDRGEESKLESYRETLSNFLACEYVVKMILSPAPSCPEE